jgi:hypothetical protein
MTRVKNGGLKNVSYFPQLFFLTSNPFHLACSTDQKKPLDYRDGVWRGIAQFVGRVLTEGKDV